MQLAVYRILQEALTNALRHGDGARSTVRLAWLADRVELEVRNPLPCRRRRGRGGAATGSSACASARSSPAARLDAGAEAGEFVVRAILPDRGRTA